LAAQVIFVILAFSQIFSTAIFPVLSSVRDDAQVFGRMATRAAKFLFLAGIPATVGGVLLAQPIIVLVSGAKYLPAVPLFMVLMFSVGFYFLSHVYVIALANFSIFRLNLQFVILFVLNAGLNFILIPIMGGVGASCATVVCEAFGLVLGFYLAAPYFKYFSFKTLLKPFLACLAASALMGFGIWWDTRLYWVALGPLVYAACIWVFRGLEPDEWKSFFSILRRRKA
jgi:O-antigen/teichoic acid export membrane protein